ncbi:MAG: DNA polymerase III subunit beta [Syntrophobacteraceae bacterium]|nr:DNA polymerase III subunit beta [Syntrophobacteraceae bacterium]
MKFQVGKANLVQVLQRIQSATEKKTTMPILNNCLIKATEDGTLELFATDLELSLWTKMAAQVQTEGKTTVSARKLLEIVREVPQDSLSFELDAVRSRLLVKAGRSRFELSTFPAEDFPNINLYQDLPLTSCNAEILKRALQKTLYSIPSEEETFSTPGLLWHATEENDLRFVSSDGHRLSYYEVPADAFPGFTMGTEIIVPRKAVQEIHRLLEKETEVSIGMDEKSLVLRTPATFLSTLLLDCEFPEYQAIIPPERPYSITVAAELLYPALKRVALVTDVSYRHVKFNISKNAIELQSGNPELGNANDIIDVEYDGEDFSVAFNVKYVMESIAAMDSQTIRFEWVDDHHGGIFLGPDDPGYLSLIMPMVV